MLKVLFICTVYTMKCKVVQMRKAGVAFPKHMLKEQITLGGELSILDVRDDGVNRVIKTARLVDNSYTEKRVLILFEPHIIWMNEGRFTLHGFERVLQEGKVVEYAQSWLCTVDVV
ncbi:MAG TPA: hypothetical protein VFF81_06420 [Noviherbaspirillum sp.]|nr:hypothetical protein [Noviherbaspirillum sp.]